QLYARVDEVQQFIDGENHIASVVALALFAVDTQFDIDGRLLRAAKFVQRHQPRPDRRAVVQCLLAEQIQQAEHFAGVARADVIADRIAEQAGGRVWHFAERARNNGDQFDFEIEFLGGRRIRNFRIRSDDRRLRFDKSKRAGWRLCATEFADMRQVIHADAENTRLWIEWRQQLHGIQRKNFIRQRQRRAI